MKRLVFFFMVICLLLSVGCGIGGSNSGSVRSLSLTGTSPSKIAFLSDRAGDGLFDLYYMNIDGSEQTRVPLDSSFDGLVWDPELSPDGSRIIFSRYGSGTADLYSVGLDGSNVLQLTSDADSYAPHFNPDGTQIVFIRLDANGIPHVWTASPDGTNAIDITVGSAQRYSSAYFSPDGTSIVAVRSADPSAGTVRSRATRPSVASGGYGSQVVSMNLDGSSVSVLESVSDNNGGVQYSVDPSSLIYAVDGSPTQIVTEPLATHARSSLTPSDSNNQSVLVAGSYVYFVSQRDGNMAVYRMNPDGTNQVRLTDPAGNSTLGMVRH